MKASSTILSQNIRFLRKQKGLNQEQLAQVLNIKRSNIAAYEAKNVEPRLRIILELAKYFDVDLQSFLEEKIDNSTVISSFRSGTKEVNQDIHSTNRTIDNTIDVKSFVDKSMNIRKILIGFKTFYSFKKSLITDLSLDKEKILSDMDNFILLMEHLLVHNESMIKAITSKQKVA